MSYFDKQIKPVIVQEADEKHKKIRDSKLHEQLENTHNNEFMQREQEKVGINITEKNDIIKLNSNIKREKRREWERERRISLQCG